MNPVCAVSVQIHDRFAQIIPLFQFREDFVPNILRFLPIRPDVKDIDAFPALSMFRNPLVCAHKRDNRVFSAAKRHMVLIGVNMEDAHLSQFPFRRRRNIAFTNLIHNGLSGNPVSRHVLGTFSVRHHAGVSDQFLIDPGG